MVRPVTVTVHDNVPLVIAMPVNPLSTRVPAVYTAAAGPLQPPLYAIKGVALFRRSPVGSVSESAMPLCAGFKPVLVRVKTRLVVALSPMLAAPKVLATFGVITVKVAFAVVPVTTTGPDAAGAVVVLTFVEVAETLCVMVQLPPGTIVAALNPTLVPPFVPPVKVAEPAPLQTTLQAAALTSVPP